MSVVGRLKVPRWMPDGDPIRVAWEVHDMNAGTIFHIPDDLLEEYALGKVPAHDSAPLDEHLLICPICQNKLAEMDNYIQVIQAGIAALPARSFNSAPSRLSRLRSNALAT